MDLINNIVNCCNIRHKEKTENQLMNTDELKLAAERKR